MRPSQRSSTSSWHTDARGLGAWLAGAQSGRAACAKRRVHGRVHTQAAHPPQHAANSDSGGPAQAAKPFSVGALSIYPCLYLCYFLWPVTRHSQPARRDLGQNLCNELVSAPRPSFPMDRCVYSRYEPGPYIQAGLDRVGARSFHPCHRIRCNCCYNLILCT